MLKDRLVELFMEYDADVQRVIAEVLSLEQEHISMKRPHVKEPIRQIIDRVARDKLDD
jgi:hypothetical protein